MSTTTTPIDPNKNYYEILGLFNTQQFEFDPTTISNEQIKSAYKSLAKIHHPDRGGNQQLFEQINTAYELLLDEKSRRQIDATWIQQKQKREYESKLNQQSKLLRDQLEQREKRYRDETMKQATSASSSPYKRAKLFNDNQPDVGDTEEIDRIKTTGYDALRKIQEQHRKRQEDLLMAHQRQSTDELLTTSKKATSSMPEKNGKTNIVEPNDHMNSRSSIFIARWKDKADVEQIEAYIGQLLGPIDKFVKMKGKKKAIVSLKKAMSIKETETKSLPYGLNLEPSG